MINLTEVKDGDNFSVLLSSNLEEVLDKVEKDFTKMSKREREIAF